MKHRRCRLFLPDFHYRGGPLNLHRDFQDNVCRGGVRRKGGGDPFFDTLHWPFNNDDDSVRYQELYREKERMENQPEALPTQPDSMKGIDDPTIM